MIDFDDDMDMEERPLKKSYAVLMHDDYVGILFLLFFSPVGSDDNMEEQPLKKSYAVCRHSFSTVFQSSRF